MVISSKAARLLADELLDAYAQVPRFGAADATMPWSDAVATADRASGSLAVALSNLHPDQPLECAIWIPGRHLAGPAELTTLTGASPDSFNDVTHPRDVSPSAGSIPATGPTCRVELPPHSVNILRVPAHPAGPA
jgi:alpha-L-arabinofuranosidase